MMGKLIEAYWPVLAVAGTGLVAWGRVQSSVADLRRDIDTKASKDTVDQIDKRLESMDNKLDRLLGERGAA
jgi:hypothetical protein